MSTTAFVDPNTVHTPSTGGTPPASWGTTVRSDLVTLATPPGCIASRTAAQSIASGSSTTIQWNATDVRDTDAYHDTVTNNTRLTVPTGLGGLYVVGWAYGMAANATGQRSFFIQKNGATTLVNADYNNNGAGIAVAGSQLIEVALVAGDYVECGVFQNSGGALNFTATVMQVWLRWLGVA